MPNVFIEPRPKGRDGDPITHYVVEDHGDSELHQSQTQQEAIDWAKQQGLHPSSPASAISATNRSPTSGGESRS